MVAVLHVRAHRKILDKAGTRALGSAVKLTTLRFVMRLWTVHPCYLDPAGLVALWREALLAQQVVRGQTTGYRNHPQLVRFRKTSDPLGCVAQYLQSVYEEAVRRGYQFDNTKIGSQRRREERLPETEGQLRYEWLHLKQKLSRRNPQFYQQCLRVELPEPHPLFAIVPGAVRDWEKTKGIDLAV